MTNTGFLRREPTRGITTYHGENPYPSPLNLHPPLFKNILSGFPNSSVISCMNGGLVMIKCLAQENNTETRPMLDVASQRSFLRLS